MAYLTKNRSGHNGALLALCLLYTANPARHQHEIDYLLIIAKYPAWVTVM